MRLPGNSIPEMSLTFYYMYYALFLNYYTYCNIARERETQRQLTLFITVALRIIGFHLSVS